MRNEDKLVYLFSRLNLDNSRISQVNALLEGRFDWDYTFNRSRREGLSGLFYYHLSNLKIDNQYLVRFRAEYHSNSFRNFAITEEFKKILKIFNEKNIQIIVLKGLFLAGKLYKNIALRPFSDIDILVRKEEIPKVNKILSSSGYVVPSNYRDCLENQTSLNALVYRKKHDINFFVHLHWHIINTTWPIDSILTRIDMQRIWAHAKSSQICGMDIFTLGTEHLLIYLCQHAFLHYFDRFILLSDVLVVLENNKDSIDWDFLKEEAERFGLSYPVYQVLLFVSKNFKYEIQGLKVFNYIKQNILQKILSFAMFKGMRGYTLFYLFYFSLQKGFLNKVRFIRTTLFPSPLILSHILFLPLKEIKPINYYRRIKDNIVSSFSA